jgi:hypothetical protein
MRSRFVHADELHGCSGWNPRTAAPPSMHPTESPEQAMFVYLFIQLLRVLDRAEHSRRDAYLASAVDLGELERRMREIEANG